MHRWSGWPGAWCLDCGAPDADEEALANDPSFDVFADPPPPTRNTACPEPGSKRHDLYAALAARGTLEA